MDDPDKAERFLKPLVKLCSQWGLPTPRMTNNLHGAKEWDVCVSIENQVIGRCTGKLSAARIKAVSDALKFIENKVIPLLEEQEEDSANIAAAIPARQASGSASAAASAHATPSKATPSKAAPASSPKTASSSTKKATAVKASPAAAAAAPTSSPKTMKQFEDDWDNELLSSFNMKEMQDALPKQHSTSSRIKASPAARKVASSTYTSGTHSAPKGKKAGGNALEKITDLIRSQDRELTSTTLIEQLNRRADPAAEAARAGEERPESAVDEVKVAAGKEIVKYLTAIRQEDDIYHGIALFDRSLEHECPETALLGTRLTYGEHGEDVGVEDILMNVHEPFCLVTLGVQGSGKSHTVGVVLENCMLQVPQVTRLKSPMCSLVLHYDQSETNICESSTLVKTSGAIDEILKRHRDTLGDVHAASQKMTILVSPSFYKQRSAFYEGYPNCTVLPLVFSWKSMTASQLKKLMCLEDDGNQLYVHVMLDLLRRFQRANKIPDFSDFAVEMEQLCSSKSQSSPLRQRFQVLESFIADSKQNAEFHPVILSELVEPGNVIIADLTDPMLSPQEANGVFQVLLEQFRSAETMGGKLVVFDEAHKYLSKNDALGEVIVDTVRQMRHLGMRVVVSTQSPQVLPAELLELVTIAVIHRFHSKDWFTHLSSKIPLPDSCFADLRMLLPGQALVFSTHHTFDLEEGEILCAQIRQRLTADCGVSLTNQAGP